MNRIRSQLETYTIQQLGATATVAAPFLREQPFDIGAIISATKIGHFEFWGYYAIAKMPLPIIIIRAMHKQPNTTKSCSHHRSDALYCLEMFFFFVNSRWWLEFGKECHLSWDQKVTGLLVQVWFKLQFYEWLDNYLFFNWVIGTSVFIQHLMWRMNSECIIADIDVIKDDIPCSC